MPQKVRLDPYSAGAGRRVHLGTYARNPKLRGGGGVICLCGVSERVGGSWVGQAETERAVDCAECRAMAVEGSTMGVFEVTLAALEGKPQAPVAPAVELDLAVWNDGGWATAAASLDDLSRRMGL